jgi:uncharacterized membrane-anchored protein
MRFPWFLVVVALQTASLLGIALNQERILAQGQVITLETVPVDPRDLLRGDYVILNYKISSIGGERFVPALTEGPPIGTPVYAVLEPKGEHYTLAYASLDRPQPAPGQLCLKGTAQSSWSRSEARVAYGLEKYFVPEGKGNPVGKITVQVAVGKSGKGVIREVLVNGKPFHEAMK